MIVGIPNKLNLFARTRVAKNVAGTDQKATRTKREKTRQPSPFSAFGTMMEHHADLLIRQMGE
ncbi:hypothetical protein EON82_02655 [bacterium]|nr:MAG: hypothetical protein EON82_02655 [bacterium]